MRAWQRVGSLMAILALISVMAGCGGGGDSTSSTASSGDGGSGSSGNGELVIGVAAGLTGYSAIFDVPALAGLKTAVEEINEKGGAGGTDKIELRVKDTASEPSKTATVAQELVGEGVNVLVTPCDSDLAISGGQAGQAAQIPTFSLCAAAPNVPESVGDYFFGTYTPENMNSAVMAKEAIETGYKTAYLVGGTETYTKSVPQYFQEAFEKLGGKIAGKSTFTPEQQDFSTIISEIKSASPAPDVIETSMYEPAFPAFMKQLRAAGIETPVIGNDAIATPTVLEQGAVMNGLVYAVGAYPDKSNEVEAVMKRTAAREGPEAAIPSYTSSGYDIGAIVNYAVEKSGGTEGTAMRDAIAGIKGLEGADSPITYDYPNSNRTPLKQLYVVEVNNGKTSLLDIVMPNPAEVPAP